MNPEYTRVWRFVWSTDWWKGAVQIKRATGRKPNHIFYGPLFVARHIFGPLFWVLR